MRTLTSAKTLLVGLLVLGMFASSLRSGEPEAKKPQAKKAQSDQQRIQGRWKPVSVRGNGQELDSKKGEKTIITFSGSTMDMPGGRRSFKPKFSLDPTKTPHQIDLKFPGEGGSTVVVKGLYRFEDDKLTICIGDFGRPRPTEFETKVGDERSLMILNRVAEGPTGTYTATLLGGEWTLKLDGKGGATVSGGGKVMVESTYKVTKDEIVLTDQKGPIACKGEEKTGKYKWKLEGKKLSFTMVEDKCQGRVMAMTAGAWVQKD